MVAPLSGIEIGPLTITYFALIVVAALALGGGYTFVAARRRGDDPEIVLIFLCWMLVCGVILGRVIYVLNPPPYVAAIYDRPWFLSHLFDLQIGVLAIWSGGLDSAGVIVGALIGFLVVIWRSKSDLLTWAKLLWPGVLLFLIVAPWANVPARQLFGPPINLPWGMVNNFRVPPFDDLSLYPPETRFHPTPIYLAIWALLVFVGYLIIRHRQSHYLSEDRIFALSVFLISLGWLLTDSLRIDISPVLFGLSSVQCLVLFVWAVGAVYLLVEHGWRWVIE